MIRRLILAFILSVSGCHPVPAKPPVSAWTEPTPLPGNRNRPTPIPRATPYVAPVPPPAPTPFPAPAVPVSKQPLIALPKPTSLTPLGDALVLEYEVGGRSGYNQRPEAPDARYSGITEGVGYDNHQNSATVIRIDWQKLGQSAGGRLAATHPYYGRSAQQHLGEVRDIIIPFVTAYETFTVVDVSREFSAARRAYGKEAFDALRPNCQAALVSVGFNRGYSFAGPNRTEMQEIRTLVPRRDYEGMALQLEKSSRVWRGTSIYNGMRRRRYAEAKLVRTP